MIPKPPTLSELHKGTQLRAGLGVTTVLADFDFETYSPAGFVWNEKLNKWGPLPGASKNGISIVGAARYTEHPEAEVLSLAYDLKDGHGRRLWTPDRELPKDLLDYVQSGGILEAWNVSFEYWVWTNICVQRYGFPTLHATQLRCAMAKARAFALPGSLDAAGKVLNISAQKDKDGTRLLKLFSVPRNPTIKNKERRILPKDLPQEAELLYKYNLRDIEAEAELSLRIPDLSEFELKFWQCDQVINRRGVYIDLPSVKSCIQIVEQAHKKYNKRLQDLTEGAVKAASEIAKLTKWINSQDTPRQLYSLTADDLDAILSDPDWPSNVIEALKIRQIIGSAAVKKLYAMANQVCNDGRLHDLFIYHSARTGRAAGAGPQPQNLPNSGPSVDWCFVCDRRYGANNDECPWEYHEEGVSKSMQEWDIEAVNDALVVINTGSLAAVEFIFDNPIDAVSGCLRSLFTAAPGHDLICSDYSAIEAVVLAELAGESWRQEVFRTHGKIYEMSASKITGIPFEEFERHKKETGQHHPMRKKVGKVAELASGYQGWVGAWKAFGADEFFDDDQIKEAILAWRAASPAIVEFWGGQKRKWTPEFYGIEGMAIAAVLNPGHEYDYRGIKFIVLEDILYCRLLSGRLLTYHRPCVKETGGYRGLSLSYEGWNSNPKMGAPGWSRIDTYGGRLTENIVQATARDILAYAIVNLEAAGYAVVLHVHDEIVAEVLESFGSVEEFEKIMSTMPEWAKDWPVKANGGWRGKRYRK